MDRIARRVAGFLVGWTMAGALLAADGRVVGRITDAAGAGVAGVRIELTGGLGLATETDTAGEYALEPVPPGRHEISFRSGEWHAHQTVEVPDGGEARADRTFGSADFAETITVFSASRRVERVTEAPAAVTIVSAEEIERRASTGQVPKLLEFTPGAQITQSGVYDFNFNTRGFNSSLNRRVAVLVDGREPSVPFLGSQEWASVSFPLDDLEQVELLRGPAAALYGANAASGVLNLITKRPRGTEGGLVRLAAGELSTVNGDARWAGKLGGSWYGKLVGGLRQSGDFTVSRRGQAEYSIPCTMRGQTDCLPQEAVPLDPEDDDDVKFLSGRVDRYVDGDRGLLTLEGGWADVSGPVFQTGIGRVQLVDVERQWQRANFSTQHFNVLLTRNVRDAPEQTALSTGNNLALDEESWKGEIQTN
ncbi:MAG TPA: TonB-dependent receptor, partial [Thermoanaerobaculia bacterium]|nr:TonB-dependent receptor [Thermoanaerobaculia bacterium]